MSFFGQAARLGASIGAVSMLWVWLFQVVAAWSAERQWILYQPAIGAVAYPLAGMLGGLLVAAVVTGLRRVFRFSAAVGLSLTTCTVALGAYTLRTFASLDLRFQSPWLPWLGSATFVLLLIALTAWLVARRHHAELRGYFLDGVRLSVFAFTFAYLFHLAFLSGIALPKRVGGLGVALGLLAAGSLLSSVLALTLAPANRGVHFGKVRRFSNWFLLISLVGVGLFAQRPPGYSFSTDPGTGPNVLLLVLDTLRRDAVSSYGLVEGTTPNLDRLAAEGVLWEDAIVPANWTIPGHASLFTGALVSRHGAGAGSTPVLRQQPGGPGTAELPTLAEFLSGTGWETHALINNPNISRANGFGRGFQRFDELWQARHGEYDVLFKTLGYFFDIGVSDQGGTITVEAVRAFLQEAPAVDRPWLLFINFLEPHAPYDPPSEWRNRFTESKVSRKEARKLSVHQLKRPFDPVTPSQLTTLWQLYLGDVAYQDHLVGQVLDALETSGEADNTVVFVTSDHGENFGWQGQLAHGISLNDHLLQVPLIARGPGIPVGVREKTPATVTDVLPTLLSLTGAPALTPDPGRTGIVLPPIGPSVDPARARLAERLVIPPDVFDRMYRDIDPSWGFARSAMLVGSLKVVAFPDGGLIRASRLEHGPQPPDADGRVELDDSDLADTLLSDLHQLLESWPRALAPTDADVELDEETRRQLEALGYVDN